MAMADKISISGGLSTFTDSEPDTQLTLDLEKKATTATVRLDIEHSTVEDDPRRWSSRRKARSNESLHFTLAHAIAVGYISDRFCGIHGGRSCYKRSES